VTGTKQELLEGIGRGAPAPPSGAEAASGESVSLIEAETVRLTTRERLALLGQLGVMLDSGIQIPAALQSMREQSPSPKIAAVLSHLEDRVRGGQSLSAAAEGLPRALPVLVRQMLAAGERAGRVGEMIQRVNEMIEAEEELRGRLRSALIYPAVMMAVALAVVIFLLTTIVPKFAGLFKGKEETLPGPTKVLLWLSDFLSTNAVWLLPGLVVVVVGTVLWLRSDLGRPYLDRFLLRLPVVKEIYSTAILSRTSRTLGMLTNAGVVILAALEHTRDVAGSPSYAALWESVRDCVANGGTISDSIRGSSLVPPTYKQLISSGESAARLDTVLLRIATHYASDLQRRVRDITTLIEPALVVFMGVVVGFIALSIMLPIFKLSQGA